jgi:hypothetical protein
VTAKLAILLLAAMTARGATHHERHALGPYVRSEQIAERTLAAARLHRLPVALYASLLLGESDFDAAARSRTGAVTMAQLQPPGVYWKAWRADCKRDQTACEQASLFAGARALREALNACRGDRACAVARYRGVRHGKVRDMDRAVVTRAWRWNWKLSKLDEAESRALLDAAETTRRVQLLVDDMLERSKRTDASLARMQETVRRMQETLR